ARCQQGYGNSVTGLGMSLFRASRPGQARSTRAGFRGLAGLRMGAGEGTGFPSGDRGLKRMNERNQPFGGGNSPPGKLCAEGRECPKGGEARWPPRGLAAARYVYTLQISM